MFHLLATQRLSAGAETDATQTRVNDPVFDSDGTSFRFTERYKIFAAMGIGLTLTRIRVNTPSLNNVIQHQIEYINRAITIQDQSCPADYLDNPYRLPMNEPVAFQSSDTAAAQSQGLYWIAPEVWEPKKVVYPDPLGLFPTSPPMLSRATVASTSVANTWVNDNPIVFETTPRGGWYAVLGADAIRANGLAFRINFRRGPTVNGRKLRPGTICRQSLDTRPVPGAPFTKHLGLWGIFHTQELPTFDLLASDAAATATEVRLWLMFINANGQGTPPIVGY